MEREAGRVSRDPVLRTLSTTASGLHLRLGDGGGPCWSRAQRANALFLSPEMTDIC